MDHLIGYYALPILIAVHVVALLCLYPLWRVFRRAGLRPWWSFAVFLPFIGFWTVGALLAFKDWPAVVAEGGEA